jgi:hypothetical protein
VELRSSQENRENITSGVRVREANLRKTSFIQLSSRQPLLENLPKSISLYDRPHDNLSDFLAPRLWGLTGLVSLGQRALKKADHVYALRPLVALIILRCMLCVRSIHRYRWVFTAAWIQEVAMFCGVLRGMRFRHRTAPPTTVILEDVAVL